jgi:integrase
MMRWEEIDFAVQTWTIPVTKNGESHTVSLTQEALAILTVRKQEVRSEWVFPSPRLKGRPLVCPKAAWRRALARADIKNLRIHDLRRTLASLMAIQGASQFVIGKTLGHKSAAATAIYARLTQAPVREAMQRATQLMPKRVGWPRT